jgi:hypothetical protein
MLERVDLKLGEIIYQADQQAAGLIAYRRARIQILDEAGLNKRSCECYRFIRRQFDGLLKEVSAFWSRKLRISRYTAR